MKPLQRMRNQMHKRPMNTAKIYKLVRDFKFPNSYLDYSEELYSGEDPKEALNIAKKLGENEVWHILESTVYACSKRASEERSERISAFFNEPA